MKKILQLVLAVFVSHGLYAQLSFTEATSTQAPFVGVFVGSVSFGDVNADGDQDVVITGDQNNTLQSARLYNNNGTGSFTNSGQGFLNVEFSSSCLKDLDGDTDLDLIIEGATSSSAELTRRFLNNGSGSFSGGAALFQDARRGKVDAFDVDADGDLDVFITGENSGGTHIARLYTNNGTGTFSFVTGQPFIGVDVSNYDYADVDNDNDLDILVTGRLANNVDKSTTLYINDGSGNFSISASQPFEDVDNGDVAFGDTDNDGDMDVVIMGQTFGGAAGSSTTFYLNDGSGNFTQVMNDNFYDFSSGELVFADFENDGDLDLLISGITNTNVRRSTIFENLGNNEFIPRCLNIAQVSASALDTADVNADGLVDFVLTGQLSSGTKISRLYYNNSTPGIKYTWTGNTSNDWADATNWDVGLVPGPNAEIILPSAPVGGQNPIAMADISVGPTFIEPGAVLIIRPGIGLTLNESLVNNGDLLFESDVTGDAYLDEYSNVCGQVIGNITMERYAHGIAGNNQHFFSFPVNGTLGNSLIDISLNGPPGYQGLTGTDGVGVTPSATCDPNEVALGSNYGTLFEWDLATAAAHPSCPEQAGWIVRSAGLIEDGRGYSAYFTGQETPFVHGPPNTDDVILTGGLQVGATINAAMDNWSVVGNPYPSPMFYNSVLSGNAAISSIAQYIPSGPWSGTYAPYLPGDLIAIGQGFAARNGSGSTADFETEDGMRSASNATTWKSNDWYQAALTIEMHGATHSDRSFIFFSNEATESFERMYDVEKRRSKAGQPSIFSLNQGVELSMQSFANTEDLSRIVDLGVEAPEQGEFTFTAADLDKIPSEYEVIFIDNELDITQNLRLNPNYTAALDGGEMLDRFQIEIVKSATSIPSIGIVGLNVYPNPTNEIVNIELSEGTLNGLNLLDLSGRKIKTFSPSQSQINVSDITKGMYLLELIQDEKKSVVKLYIN